MALSAEKTIQDLKISQEWEVLPSERFAGVCMEIWRVCFPSLPPPPAWEFENCGPRTTEAIRHKMQKLQRLGDSNEDSNHDISRMIRAALVLGFGHHFGSEQIGIQARKTNVNSALAAVLCRILGTGVQLTDRSIETAKSEVLKQFTAHCENREERRKALKDRIAGRSCLLPGFAHLLQEPRPPLSETGWERSECTDPEDCLRLLFSGKK